MKISFLLFLFLPFFVFAQHQPTAPVNGSTDCPDFSKKNTFSKADMFQQMRTRKPQKTQQPIYRTDAPAIVKTGNPKSESTISTVEKEPIKRPTRVKNTAPVQSEEEVVTTRALPRNEETSHKADESHAENDSSVTAETKETQDASAVRENKKEKKILFKNKIKHRPKTHYKRTSRKKAVKCPEF